MKNSFTRRSKSIEPFQVMALLAKAKELEAKGKQVIHLEIGEPDVKPYLSFIKIVIN